MKKLLVLLAAVAFVVAFTVPAMSADWNFYGSSRMTTFVNDVEPEGLDSDSDLTWNLQGNSRIGAKVKAGDIGGGFEYGTGINLRLLYATWNFGAGKLLVGQHYTPVFSLVSNQVWGSDNDLVSYGGIYTGRRPMIRFSTGGLKIALVTPKTGSVVAASTDTDSSLPTIEASYSFNLGSITLKPMFGYNTYTETIGNDLDIDSYILGLQFTSAMGPAYVKGSIYTGTNLGSYGIYSAAASSPIYDAVNNKIVDNDNLGYQLIVGFKASDALTFEFGYGHTESELDQAGSAKDEACSYYANAVINIAKGFFIVPEIGKTDHKNVSETTYYGAKWQINF